MAFNIALSGLNAASTDLEVTGNNVANSATNGFKQSRAEFSDVYATSIQDQTATSSGRGVRVSNISQQFSQGSVEFTSNNLDLAISGEGFFVLKDSDGSQTYTRAGAYSVDRDGNVVNQANQKLQAYPAVSGTDGSTSFTTGVLGDLTLPTSTSAPTLTSTITSQLNLNATAEPPTVATIDPTDPASFNSSTSITIFDSLGNGHTATMYFAKDPLPATNAWTGALYVDGTAVPSTTPAGTTFPLVFDTNGAIDIAGGNPESMVFDDLSTVITDWPGGAQTPTINFNGTTQYGAPFSVNNLSQNGFSSGRLSGIDIDAEGVVFARFTNGQSNALGKVAMAKFNNPQGLRPIGSTNWAETFDSGNVQLGEAGTSSLGLIQSGALEASNVDITEQLVNLIVAQRNFQANAEVISTSDTITQTIINI